MHLSCLLHDLHVEFEDLLSSAVDVINIEGSLL